MLVSHLMPVWRPRTTWLHSAVRTALAQTDANVELVVVDDGNPEPVEPLLEPFRDDPRLRVVRIEHGGLSVARNAAFAAARGELIRYVDADDEIPPDSTAKLAALAAAHPGAIAYGATMFCDEELRPRWLMTSRARGDAIETSVLSRFTVRITAMVFPRDVHAAAGPWDPDLGTAVDWEWTVRALEHAPVVGTTDLVAYYRRHGDGHTADHAAGTRTANAVVDRYFARHPERRGTAFERRARARIDATEARVALTHGRPRAALAPLGRALRASPRALLDELAVGAEPAQQLLRHRARRVPSES